jgi:hypothetical protein
MILGISSKDIMIFTKVKGNLGKWPQDIPVLMRTMAADVKNPLARRSHFDRHNECHIGRIWTGPFASTWPNRLSGNIYNGNLRRYMEVVNANAFQNFGELLVFRRPILATRHPKTPERAQ